MIQIERIENHNSEDHISYDYIPVSHDGNGCLSRTRRKEEGGGGGGDREKP